MTCCILYGKSRNSYTEQQIYLHFHWPLLFSFWDSMKDLASKKDEKLLCVLWVPSSSSLRSCSSSYFIFLFPLNFSIIFSPDTYFCISRFLKTIKQSINMLFFELTSLYLMTSIATILQTANLSLRSLWTLCC